jgi:hypothetical protein
MLKDCCQQSYDEMQVSVSEAFNICTLSQGSVEWKHQRKYRITGSICYNIYTAGKRGFCDWDKRVKNMFEPVDISHLPAVAHGHAKEKEAKMTYSSHFNVAVRDYGLVIPSNHPWLGYSPDGIVFCNNKPIKLIEIKCPLKGKFCNIKDVNPNFLTSVDENLLMKKNHAYYGQVQLGMAIFDLPVCDIIVHASYDKSQLIVPVYRNDSFLNNFLSELQLNFFKHILHYKCYNRKC